MSVFVAFALLATSAAPAEAAASSSVSPATPAVKEKKICRTEEAVIGSIASKRTCKTRAEWDALLGRTQSAGNQQSSPQASGTSNR
jgi:hypothetical protein